MYICARMPVGSSGSGGSGGSGGGGGGGGGGACSHSSTAVDGA